MKYYSLDQIRAEVLIKKLFSGKAMNKPPTNPRINLAGTSSTRPGKYTTFPKRRGLGQANKPTTRKIESPSVGEYKDINP